MPNNNSPGGPPPGFDPNSQEPSRRSRAIHNSYSEQPAPENGAAPGYDPAIDSQQQLSLFFPSGVDNELEAALKPLFDASFTGPFSVPTHPENSFDGNGASPHQTPVSSMSMPGVAPGAGPFPVGMDPDIPGIYQPPATITPSGKLRPIQPININVTTPLSVPGTVPVAVARPGSTGALTSPSTTTSTGTLNGYSQTYTTGSASSYTSPQFVQNLALRILSGIPTSAILERSPEIEQMLAGRFMSALSEIPGPVPANVQPILFRLVLDEVLGLGPLEPLMQDVTITEIMVNGPSQVWVERTGQLVDTDVKFQNEDHLMRTAARMAAQMGRRLDRKWPMLDGRLPDGSRVNIIAPPCSLHGTSITIRKFSGVPLTISRLIDYGTVTQELADFLRTCVLGRLNILVAGGPGSGKTTLLNAIASFIPEDERIVTVEESAELRLDHRHVVALETRPPDYETLSGGLANANSGEVTMRHLVVNALRMRAERLLVGEIGGGEVLDLITAMNTGHDGVLATMHASTPRDAVSHLESMALMSGTNLPARSLREAIATAVDLVVQVARLRDGTRRAIYVTEVRGMEGDTIALKDIFRWNELIDEENGSRSGVLEPTGHTPRFVYRLQDRGLKIDRNLFSA